MGNTFGRPYAVAAIRGSREAPLLKGMVRFYQRPYGVLVEAEISGLPNNVDGFFGFHIHEGSACSGEDFKTAGEHFDPRMRQHPHHAGDLPPLLSYGGRAYLTVVTDRFSIRDVIGRTVIIHSRPDDFRTQPGGNADSRIACGTITRSRRASP